MKSVGKMSLTLSIMLYEMGLTSDIGGQARRFILILDQLGYGKSVK